MLNKPLTPSDVRAFLVNTTQGSSDQDPGIVKATATLSGVPGTAVFVTVVDHSIVNDAYSYNVAFSGTSGQQLTALTVTLPSNRPFYPGQYPITAGSATGATPPSVSSSSASNFGTTATLNFTSFDPGDTLAFGVCHLAQVGTANNYYTSNRTDLLAGGTISCTITGANAGTYTGTLANTASRKWNYKSGYGLIDINAAITALTNGN